MMENRLRSERVTPPATPLISAEDLKVHCRVLHSEEDEYFGGLAWVISDHFEGVDGAYARCFISQVWRDEFRDFSCLELALAPVPAVSELSYINRDGATVVVDPADYRVMPYRTGSLVEPVSSFPSDLSDRADAVRVTYSVGYGGQSDVPNDVRHAARLLAGHWYEHREDAVMSGSSKPLPIPRGVDWLMQKYRRYKL